MTDVPGIDYDSKIMGSGLRYRTAVPRSERQLRKENVTDFKTGLLNERGLSREIIQQIRHCERTGESLTIVFIDADRFKKINSKYEYHGGDTVLRSIANAMNEEFRSEDSKARWGGDEFIALMSREKSSLSPVDMNLEERLNRNIKSKLPSIIDPSDVSVTVASIEWNGESPEDLLKEVQKHILEHKSKND